jgi:hypothetical protein
MKINKLLLLAAVSLCLQSCKKDPETNPHTIMSGFGEVTSAVVIVNPVINKGSSTSVVSGSQRGDVSLQAASLAAVKTDVSGLAVVENLPTGTVPLKFATGTIQLNVVNPKEHYDVVVSVKDNGVQEVISAVRYPITGPVIFLNPGQSISQAANVDNAIIFLKEGKFTENVEVKGAGVLIFGSWSPVSGQLSTIEGNLSVLGGSTRVRGLQVTGKITASANSFSAAFCHFYDASITGNNNSLIRNVFSGPQITVPSSSAVLVDNIGIP